MNKQIFKKNLFVCLVISLALIVAGAFVCGFLGFNADSTMSGHSVVQVSDVSFGTRDDATVRAVTDFYTEQLEGKGFAVSDVKYVDELSTGIGSYEFYVTGEEPSDAVLEELRNAIDGANISGVDSSTITVSYHVTENKPYTEYIWRASIAAAVAVVILFAYVAIRFRFGMGIAAFIAGIHDVLLTLAVVALVRIPSGTYLIGAAVIALLLSAALNMFLFGRMRADLRTDEMKEMPAREAVALSAQGSRKGILTFAVCAAAVFAVLAVAGIFVGLDLTFLMVGALISVAVSVYSALLFTPAVYAGIKSTGDAMAAKRKARSGYQGKAGGKDAQSAPQEAAANAE